MWISGNFHFFLLLFLAPRCHCLQYPLAESFFHAFFPPYWIDRYCSGILKENSEWGLVQRVSGSRRIPPHCACDDYDKIGGAGVSPRLCTDVTSRARGAPAHLQGTRRDRYFCLGFSYYLKKWKWLVFVTSPTLFYYYYEKQRELNKKGKVVSFYFFLRERALVAVVAKK